MHRAVLDTNILVSAVITPRGTPAKILQGWREGAFELVTSPPLLREIKEALSQPKIARRYGVTAGDIRDFLNLLATEAHLVGGMTSVAVHIRDPDDIPFLSCAVEGQAGFLVTGDSDLLELKSFRSIQIVRPANFLRIVFPSN